VNNSEIKLAVIGLGYVGLPLASEFGCVYEVIGFDLNAERIRQLNVGIDTNNQVSFEKLSEAKLLRFTDNEAELDASNTYIVTVPTPIDDHNSPDLGPLLHASEIIGRKLKVGDTVIYESTVYPGATEEVCVPQLERTSGLRFNQDFTVGYSPERINPGDSEHTFSNICKVTSGSSVKAAEFVDSLYSSVVTAGTHLAPSIRVAEAAKVIENTQRDINIALMNELSIIFQILDIDTSAVLAAARTKWNFLPFTPGLVGGHCIGVDPYYLTYKAQEVGYHPEVILAGRRLNDSMGNQQALRLIRSLVKAGGNVKASKVLVMGLTFKENCSDLRNTKVIDVINTFVDYEIAVEVYDPVCRAADAFEIFNIELVDIPKANFYDAIFLAVAHDDFERLGLTGIRSFGKPGSLLFDLKGMFKSSEVDLSV